MTLSRRTDPLRFIAVRLAVPELEQVVRQPGIGEAYRITVQYQDGRYPDQVATLAFRQLSGQASGALSGGSVTLTVHYRRPNDKPLILTPALSFERCREFAAALRALNFDKLDDMPDVPWYGADLWLVERASGSFHHDMVIAPDRAAQTAGIHAAIVALVRERLREAVRTISL